MNNNKFPRTCTIQPTTGTTTELFSVLFCRQVTGEEPESITCVVVLSEFIQLKLTTQMILAANSCIMPGKHISVHRLNF